MDLRLQLAAAPDVNPLGIEELHLSRREELLERPAAREPVFRFPFSPITAWVVEEGVLGFPQLFDPLRGTGQVCVADGCFLVPEKHRPDGPAQFVYILFVDAACVDPEVQDLLLASDVARPVYLAEGGVIPFLRAFFSQDALVETHISLVVQLIVCPPVRQDGVAQFAVWCSYVLTIFLCKVERGRVDQPHGATTGC